MRTKVLYITGLIGLIFASLIITFGLGIDDLVTGEFVNFTGGLNTLIYIPVVLILLMVGAVVIFRLFKRKR